MTKDWVILGGGPIGTHIALRLHVEGKVPLDRIAIIDREPELLTRWKERTARVGMQYLRSPSVHHLGINPLELLTFAKKQGFDVDTAFTPPYQRPLLSLFNAHAESWIERAGLASCHLQTEIVAMRPTRDGVLLTDASGQTFSSRRVVLSLGQAAQPIRPELFAGLPAKLCPHLFAPEVAFAADEGEPAAVFGAGLSAVQAALRLASQGIPTTLFTSHALREHDFDSDPGWLGPKFMAGFWRTEALEERRQLIQSARRPGTIPSDARRALDRAIHLGRIRLSKARGPIALENGRLQVPADAAGPFPPFARIWLATGLCGARPGGALLSRLAEEHHLALAPCGFPIVDQRLRWHPQIYTAGILAELELGPTARNIAGARRAAERLVAEALADRRASHAVA